MRYRVRGNGWEEDWSVRREPLGRDWELKQDRADGAAGPQYAATVQPIEEGIFRITVSGATHTITLLPGNKPGTPLRFLVDGDYFELVVEDESDLLEARLGGKRQAAREAEIHSVMPGVIRKVLATPGTRIEIDQPILILEAMKMENEIRSPVAGTLERLCVEEGGTVSSGELLAVVSAR